MYINKCFIGLVLTLLKTHHGTYGTPTGALDGVIGEGGITFDPETETVFYLYTPSNEEQGQTIRINNSESLEISNFNPILSTRVIIHGFTNNYSSPVNQLIRTAYFQKGEFNVIVVDWSKGAKAYYPQAASYVNAVGKVVAQFLNFLCTAGELNIEDVYLIGHSLGGHVAGFAGKYMQSLYQKIIPTIFGLDVALPFFYLDNPDTRLNSTDALNVIVIHTNILQFGFVFPIGTIDFYPNMGGPVQPGCELSNNVFCSHKRAFEYFAESINTVVGFIAHECILSNLLNVISFKFKDGGNHQSMGGETSQMARNGVYCLSTNSEPLYAKGDF